MATILNLNRARKRKKREEKRKLGTENSVKFGRSKSSKNHNDHSNAKAQKSLNQHRLDE